MRTPLLILVALSGAAALVLPARYSTAQRLPELQDLGSPELFGSLDSSGSFSVPLQRVQVLSLRSFEQAKTFMAQETLRLQFKHGNSTGRRRQSTLSEDGSVHEQPDNAYYAQISIGTPPQKLLVSIDTGSSDLRVFTWRCSDACGGCATFDSSTSSTYRASTPAGLLHIENQVKGQPVAADTFRVADFEAKWQRFLVSDSLGSKACRAKVSISVLSFGSASSSGSTPLWELLARSGKLASPLFTLQLSRQHSKSALASADESAGILVVAGLLTFGSVDASQYTGRITYSNLISPNRWVIPLDSVSVNGQRLPVPAADRRAIIDSETELIGGPAEIIEAIYAQVPGARKFNEAREAGLSYYELPCDSKARISLSFGGKDWSMRASDLLLSASNDATEEAKCMGVFYALSWAEDHPDNPSWIVGTSFLKNVFQVYDGGFGEAPPRIGFAALRNSPAQTATHLGSLLGRLLLQSQSRVRSIRGTGVAPLLKPYAPS